MKKLFNQLSFKIFAIISILFALIGDILIFTYSYKRFSSGLDLFTKLLKIAFSQQNLDFSLVDQNFIREQFQFYTSLLATILALLFTFHLIIYVLYFFEKKIGKFYLAVYSSTASIGCFLASITMITKTPLYALIFVIQAALYTFIACGLWHFRAKSQRAN